MSNHPFGATEICAVSPLKDFDALSPTLSPDLSATVVEESPSRSLPVWELGWPDYETPLTTEADWATPLFEPGELLQSSLSGAIADPLLANPTVDQIWQTAQEIVSQFWQTTDQLSALSLVFGEAKATAETVSLVDQFLAGATDVQVRVIPQADLPAYGAYVAATNTILLTEALLSQPTQAVSVLLEEIGHAIDDATGLTDAPGDEGALFAALVSGYALASADLFDLRTENDHASVVLDGQTLAIEKADFGPGTFVVGPTGQIAAEFIADSGAYEGQLAVFSLEGMDGFAPNSSAFIQEAARRALTNAEGYIIVNDITEAASLNGELGEKNRNSGTPTGIKAFAFAPGTRIAVMLVPNGTVQAIFDNPAAGGDLQPIFSLPVANPGNRVHLGEIRPGVFAMEDLRFDTGSDADFNDVIFRLQGAAGQVEAIANLLGNQQIWVNTPLGQQLFLISDEALGNPTTNPTAQPIFIASNNPIFPPVNPNNLQVSIPTSGVPSFNAGSTEADIAASGAARITIGTQTIYIGTNQVSANNQNPIVASFDSANPANNWIRTDFEVTGADGRGVGLAWDGNSLYGVFTVDGTQGSPAQDFRRAANDAQQAWLRSYGQGGGPKVSVLARIDSTTGELLDAAYLSAVLSNGNSNTLTIDDINVNSTGHLVISAQSFFRPRRPDGTALTETAAAGTSPFAYTVEITPDLKRVTSTSAVGFV